MIIKILKWTGIILVGIIVLVAAAYAYISFDVNSRANRLYSFPKENLEINADSATLARGKHLMAIKGCQDCHGEKLEGKIMADDGAIGRLVATNITKGKGGLPQDYRAVDWITALRHGVDRNGKPLLLMPSHETTLLTEEDLKALVAYCEQVVPVDNELPESEIGPVAMVMTYLGKMPMLAVEKIDHNKPMLASVDSVEGPELGRYLAVSCSGCHRENLKGGEPLAPGFPPVPDITSSGHVGKWSQDQFIKTLTTGKTPEGHILKNEDMPWKMTAQYTRTELASLYKFLKTIN